MFCREELAGWEVFYEGSIIKRTIVKNNINNYSV